MQGHVALVLAFATACTGTIGDSRTPLNPISTGGVRDFECVSATPALDSPLRRLSRNQLINTLEEVLGRLLPEAVTEQVLAEVAPQLIALPNDLRIADEELLHGQQSFFRADQTIGNATVAGHYNLAFAVARALTTEDRLSHLGFSCALEEGATDGACIDGILEAIGPLTHRRPLEDAERAYYRDEVYQTGDVLSRPDLLDMVAVLFAQPGFVFHVEGTGELTPFEAANRLAYQFWNSMPDEELYAAAESGELLTSSGWQAQVERAIDDPRARDAIENFVFQWFRFDQVNLPSTGSGPDFDAIRGDLVVDPSFDEAIQEELVDLFMHVLRTGGTFEDFFLTEVTTTTHPGLARLYGVSPAAPGGTVAVPPERRSILTRPGLLVSRAEIALPTINSITHPILRGVFVRRQVICDVLPAAPAGAMDDLPVVDRSTIGSREATELLTSPAGCISCHSSINPTGYALEAFDAIGQLRNDEPLFDEGGNVTMALPIDDVVTLPEQREPIQGGAELAQVLWDSEKVGACFSRHYVRFTLGRTERLDADGCLLAAVDEAIDDELPLRDVLAMALLEPELRVRPSN
ncbi:MAG: DUF1592 domain-containing protein [Myxococcota bacterium]